MLRILTLRTSILLLATVALGAPLPARAAGPEGGRLLATIRFDQGAVLGPAAQRALLEASKELEGKADLALFLIGHTDDRGTNAANLALGKDRAAAVKDWLVKRGVSEGGIKAASRGEEEPIQAGTTPEIRALNRRVEIWIAAKTAEVVARSDRPYAWISWFHRDAAAKPRAGADWSPARTKMPLEKLDRVRTRARSAAEVSFRTEDQLYLGDDAEVLIHGRDDAARRAAPRGADLTLERGAMFTRLSHVEAPTVVATKVVEVKVKSRSARVAHDDARGVDTVAVYDGDADVTAKGKTLRLAAGYGTRIKAGGAPEPATKLVPPPAWTTPSGATGFAGKPASLAWRYTDTSSAALLEVSSALEDGPNRPLESLRAPGTAKAVDLEVGAYVVRPRALDARGIPGTLGEPTTLVVLDPPVDAASGAPVPVKDGALHLAKPGKVRFVAPPGTSIGLGGAESAVGASSDARLDQPGRTAIQYRLVRADGRVVARGAVDAVVDAPAAEPVVAEQAAQTPIRSVQRAQPDAEGPSSIWPMAELKGGLQLGPHGVEPALGLFLGATVRLGETARFDFGPWVEWYQAQLQRGDGRQAASNVFPFQLRLAFALDLGTWRPYLGGSGGMQLVRPTKAARDLGLVLDGVQPGWAAFVGAGIPAGPGSFLIELDYGKVAVEGAGFADDLGGPSLLLGYRFGAR